MLFQCSSNDQQAVNSDNPNSAKTFCLIVHSTSGKQKSFSLTESSKLVVCSTISGTNKNCLNQCLIIWPIIYLSDFANASRKDAYTYWASSNNIGSIQLRKGQFNSDSLYVSPCGYVPCNMKRRRLTCSSNACKKLIMVPPGPRA